MHPGNRTRTFAAWLSGLLASMVTLPALAGAFISFSGTGQVTQFGPPDASGDVSLRANGDYVVDGVADWILDSPFTFNYNSGTGSGTFDFSELAGNSFSGTLTSTADVQNGTFVGFFLNYTILSGGGPYAAGGSGTSYVTLTGPPVQVESNGFITFVTPYSEAGRFHIPERVPEPGTLALLGLGLAGLGMFRRRRAN